MPASVVPGCVLILHCPAHVSVCCVVQGVGEDGRKAVCRQRGYFWAWGVECYGRKIKSRSKMGVVAGSGTCCILSSAPGFSGFTPAIQLHRSQKLHRGGWDFTQCKEKYFLTPDKPSVASQAALDAVQAMWPGSTHWPALLFFLLVGGGEGEAKELQYYFLLLRLQSQPSPMQYS